MDSLSVEELRRNVAAQATFRLKFGVLVASMLMVGFFVALSEERSTGGVVVAMYALYVAYACAAYFLARSDNIMPATDLVMVTAVIDPFFLTVWLFLAGDSGYLVVGLYLFTILGFGFRIGAVAMHVCQAISLLGFSAVLMASPIWHGRLLFGFSHVFLLIVVPVYASVLIRRIHAAKAQAEHESLAKSRLLAKVSHELRTPLTGITAAAELLEVETQEPETLKRALSIQRLATRLESEIKQLLELSTLEHGRAQREDEKAPFLLSDVANQAFRNLESIADGKGLSLNLEFDERLDRPVLGLPDKVVAVLMNLAGNAVKFTQEGSITLQVRQIGGSTQSYQVWFGVTDTGIGIAPEHLERIFEPFYQVEEGCSKSLGGTGLGTTIARELVRAMGGELRVDSTPGQGSVFWFTLDLPITTLPSHDAREQVDVGGSAPQQAMRVLVADDNVTNLELMAEMLRTSGHQVTAVAGGEEALQKLASEPYDIIFLDYNMGDVDGAMVFQTYSFGRIETAPTFFVTADTTALTTQALNEIGAAGVIYKPLTFDKLRTAFDLAFGGQPAIELPAVEPRRAAGAGLAVVPVEYIDLDILDELRSIRDKPGFVAKIVGDGMKDMAGLRTELSQACTNTDLHAVHRAAHTLKGVCVNIGAVRLAALADRMMGLSYEELAADPRRWSDDVQGTTTRTLTALDELRRSMSPPSAVNN